MCLLLLILKLYPLSQISRSKDYINISIHLKDKDSMIHKQFILNGYELGHILKKKKNKQTNKHTHKIKQNNTNLTLFHTKVKTYLHLSNPLIHPPSDERPCANSEYVVWQLLYLTTI